MKTLDQANRCKKTIDALLRVHRESYQRDENFKPIGVDWDLEKHSTFFIGLLNLRDELELITESLNKL